MARDKGKNVTMFQRNVQMKKQLQSIIVSSLVPLVLSATALPQATSKTSPNLQNYLLYNFETKLAFTCKQKSSLYICQSEHQSLTEIDENNVTSSLSFEKMQIQFNTSLAPKLEKKPYSQIVQEINNATQESEMSLTDALNRALFENLTHITLDKVDIKNSDPRSHITVKKISYDNTMKKSVKGASFQERIFGDIELRYRQAFIDSDASQSFTQDIPMMLEEWFETNNKTRAKYVSQKLHELYKNEKVSPFDGSIKIHTQYLGNDAIKLRISAENDNHHNTSGGFKFDGELYNISTLIASTRSVKSAGMPDFLFKNLTIQSYNKADKYRILLKSDKKLANYVKEYTQLLQKHFDTQIQSYTNNTKLINWFKQTKEAFSKILQAKVEKLNITISNKSGTTAMQLFGIMMGRMTQAPKKGQAQASQEQVISDIVTEQLDYSIKAY